MRSAGDHSDKNNETFLIACVFSLPPPPAATHILPPARNNKLLLFKSYFQIVSYLFYNVLILFMTSCIRAA